MKLFLKVLLAIAIVGVACAIGALVAGIPITANFGKQFFPLFGKETDRNQLLKNAALKLKSASLCEKLPDATGGSAGSGTGVMPKNSARTECLTDLAVLTNDTNPCGKIRSVFPAATKVDCLMKIATVNKNAAACALIVGRSKSWTGIEVDADFCRSVLKNMQTGSGATIRALSQNLCNADADCLGICQGKNAVSMMCRDGRCKARTQKSEACGEKGEGWSCVVFNGVAGCRKPEEGTEPFCNSAADCLGVCRGNDAFMPECKDGRCSADPKTLERCDAKGKGWSCSVLDGVAQCRRPKEGDQKACNKASDCTSYCQGTDLVINVDCRDGRCGANLESSKRCSEIGKGYACSVFKGIAACRRPPEGALEECNEASDCTTSCQGDNIVLLKTCTDGRCAMSKTSDYCDRYGEGWKCSVVNRIAACRKPRGEDTPQECNTSDECRTFCDGTDRLVRMLCQGGRCTADPKTSETCSERGTGFVCLFYKKIPACRGPL
ncbi:MAG: hypothetical protein PHE68_05845 [Candidatus Peribacteraceae bacterium]|nr:hypothetical protein [Candidatus Peribacteraceae bacterium]MDD5075404.1 hypothetical protein [Candidatus Peribacteraceae bacterium]